MSDQERQQRIGKAYEDLKNRKCEYELLTHDAEKLGENLISLGQDLTNGKHDSACERFASMPDRHEIELLLRRIIDTDKDIMRLKRIFA